MSSFIKSWNNCFNQVPFSNFMVSMDLLTSFLKSLNKSFFILLAAPKALNYYPKIGMKQWEHCYVLDNINDIK